MTVLSDRDIRRELSYAHGLSIEGLDLKDIGPASVDVYLGDTFVVTELACGAHIGENENVLHMDPLSFALGTTREVITLPDNIMANVHGCSSIGRTGLFVQNAGLIDPGWGPGQITLELFNASDTFMTLIPGQRIAQLSFQYLHTPCAKPYAGRYVGQMGATAARPKKEQP